MKFKWIVITVFVLVVGSKFMFSSKKNEVISLPENLMGKWTTSEPKYINRFLELTKTGLTYGLGENQENVYIISSVEKGVESNNILYTINYKDTNGSEFTRSFYYESANGGVIKFKNQENIEWTKEEDDTV
jgi:hypothetical protein